jgi:hypothetical protein
MDWYFRDISDDPSEKELTQQDQFNNDEVALAEALVRETIQNSTDASSNGSQVRVRFALKTISTPAGTSIIRQMVDGVAPNLKASELVVPQNLNSTRLLVVEDFGTTGLKGAVDVKDDGQFCGFWPVLVRKEQDVPPYAGIQSATRPRKESRCHGCTENSDFPQIQILQLAARRRGRHAHRAPLRPDEALRAS